MTKHLLFILLSGFFSEMQAQQKDHFILLKPDRVFDGTDMHQGWIVLVKNDTIAAAGSMQFKLPAATKVSELKGCTLLPGLIEGHSHLFLHPYNETSWDDQVLKESRAERIARAVTHAKATLMAGFTTVRDLGTEGAGYDDVGLKKSVEKGIIPGPRMIVATKAIVAKGAYGPKTDNADIEFPIGAAEVTGIESMNAEVRTQLGKGADIIKIYADYRYSKNGASVPTFTKDEIETAVIIAKNTGHQVVVHASTPQGMLNSINAGVSTIEHGDNGTDEIFKLMKEKNIALCPTLAATEATEQYKGWKKGIDPETGKVINKKKTFALALKSDVTICMGGDVGVFAHGDNAREMELMVDYGMNPIDVLRSATSVNAAVFGYGNKIGSIKKGLLADMIVVENDPSVDIKNIRKIKLIMKSGVIIQN